LNGQILEITQEELSDLSLCQESSLYLQIKNQSTDSTGLIDLRGTFPDGLRYVLGTVIGAVEANISDLSRPQFKIPSLLPGQSRRISLKIAPGCRLYDSVNQGTLFSNQWVATGSFGVDSSSTRPFSIYTGFLVFGNVPSITKETGSSFQRSVSITNTRLGPISSFIFEDRHEPILLSSGSGKTLENSDTVLRLELGIHDFMQIGDRDSLFEAGESIIIVEQIHHKACTTEIIRSAFTAYWGCDSESCQEYRESSQIDFIQPSRSASLEFTPDAKFPECICDPMGALQEFKIKNTGGAVAENVMISFKASQALSAFDVGFLKDSIFVHGGRILDVNYINPVKGTSCLFDSAFHEIKISLADINPNEGLSIFLRFVTCRNSQPELATNFPWFYSFSYNSVCIPNSERRGIDRQVNNFSKASSIKVQLGLSPFDIQLLDNKKYTAKTQILLNKAETDKNLIIQYNIPCPFILSDTLFPLLGKMPIRKQISGSSPYVVLLEYAPPFPSSFTQTFDLIPDCRNSCLKGSEFGEIDLVSSCPFDRDILADMVLKICAKASLSCSKTDLACGPVSLNDPPFELNCLIRSERQDTVPGYILFEDSLYRKNIGLADPDDDRLADMGSSDFSKSKSKNFITGDTIVYEFNGRIYTDISLNFDSLSILIGSDLSYSFIHSHIRIVKKDRAAVFEFEYPITDTFRSVNPLPNCSNPVIRSNPLGKGILIPLTPELIRLHDPGFPQEFIFEEGDSIYCITTGKISSFTEQRIATLPILTRMAVNARSKPQSYLYSCLVGIDTIKLTSLGLNWVNPQATQYICSDEFSLGSQSIRLTPNLDNFFSHEYRSLVKVDSFYFTVLNGIQYTGIEVEMYYTTNGTRILHKKDTLDVRQIGTNLYSNLPGAFDSFEFDEAFELELRILGRMLDCSRVNGAITTSLFCSGQDSSLFFIPPSFSTFYPTTVFTNRANIEILNATQNITQATRQIFAFGSDINWSMQMTGQSISGDLTFELFSSKGSISDFKIQVNPLTNVDTILPGLFKVKNTITSTPYSFLFSATTKSCERDTVYIIITWTCNGNGSEKILGCTRDTFLIDIIPEDPELELDMVQKDLISPLCDTLPSVTGILYNADRGNAVDVYLDVHLPEGIFFVPGQQFYSYPIQTAKRTLPQPIEITGGTYRWYLSDLDTTLSRNGLKGVYASPENSIEFTFLTATDCNSTVNGSISMTAGGKNNCGMAQNKITRSGPRIRIQGADQSKSAKLDLSYSPTGPCPDTLDIHISLEPNYRTGSSDSLEIWIPGPLTYVPFSFREQSNFGLREPGLISITQGQKLIFSLNSLSGAGDRIKISIRLAGLNQFACGERELDALLFFSGGIPCKATGGNCLVKQQISNKSLFIQRDLPKAEIIDFKVVANNSSPFASLDFSLNISNTSSQALSELCLAWILDLDASGDWTPGDSVADEIKLQAGQIRQDGKYSFNLNRNTPPFISCSHLLVILPKNCLCETDTFVYRIENKYQRILEDTVCHNTVLKLGKAPILPYRYHWIKGVVPCDSCSEFDFSTYNDSDSLVTYRFVLTEGIDSNCQNTYEYLISIFPQSPDSKRIWEECPGTRVVLHADESKDFLWIGTGIKDPLDSIQIVIVKDSVTYLLQYKDSVGCWVTDSFCIWPKINLSYLKISNDTTVVKGSKVLLCVSGGKTYQWESEEGLSCLSCPCNELVAEKTNTYRVLVIDSIGCPHELEVTVFVSEPECVPEDVFLPNAFSPNEDGKNDVLFVRTDRTDLSIYLAIYNRWGELVFESDSPAIGWNGKYREKDLSPDVYGYYLTVKCPDGKTYFKKGNISLLK